MATFNAETAFKSTEKRLDKLEAAVQSLEKAVKVLIDTRGDSKEDAVKKLQAVVEAQSKDIASLPTAQIKAIEAAIAANEKKFAAMLKEEQKAAVQDFDKAQRTLHDELRKQVDAWNSSEKEMAQRLALLHKQAETQASKRDQEQQKQIDDMARQMTDAAKAQAAAASSAAQLEVRFAKLEGLVAAALARR